MKSLLPLLFTLLASAAAPALADTPIDQTHALAANAELSIDNVAGSVTVQVWDQPGMHLTGSLGEHAKLAISGTANDLKIKVKQTQGNGWFGNHSMGPSALKLMVPKGIHLDVDTVSASISAKGLRGGKIELESVSGDIRLQADSPDVDVETVSGEVRLAGHADKLEASSVSGDVHVAQAGGHVEVETVSGDVRLRGGPFHKLDVETVSGRIEASGAMAGAVQADLHSMSGDIRLGIINTPDWTLQAKTLSGAIHTAFGQVQQDAHGPSAQLQVRTGQGRGQIKLRSYSGNIDIRNGN